MRMLKIPFTTKKEDYVDAVLMLSLGHGDTIYNDVGLLRSIEPRVVAGESDEDIKESLGHNRDEQSSILKLIDNLLSMAPLRN